MRLYEQTIPCGTLCYQDCSPFVRLDLVVMELASKSEINYLGAWATTAVNQKTVCKW